MDRETRDENGFIFKSGLPPCLIYVDKEGDWYHNGAKIFRKDILKIFYENLSQNSEGIYVINWHNDNCYLDVEDTPFVICQVDAVNGRDDISCFYITLKNTGWTEQLDPETLWIGEENVLYCLINNKTYPARFLRPPYYELASYIQEDPDNNSYYIELQGVRYYIQNQNK